MSKCPRCGYEYHDASVCPNCHSPYDETDEAEFDLLRRENQEFRDAYNAAHRLNKDTGWFYSDHDDEDVDLDGFTVVDCDGNIIREEGK